MSQKSAVIHLTVNSELRTVEKKLKRADIETSPVTLYAKRILARSIDRFDIKFIFCIDIDGFVPAIRFIALFLHSFTLFFCT